MTRYVAVLDGYYEVNRLGQIRRAKPGISTFVGRPVQPVEGPTGYAQVQLRDASGPRRMYVHHVIAEAFLGPRPRGHVVNHKDGSKMNNAASNLEYVTYEENARHALQTRSRRKGPTKPKAPLKGPQTGDKHWSRRMPERVARGERMAHKVTARNVRTMRALRLRGHTVQSIADRFEISVGQTSRILRGQRWSHVQ